MLIEPLRADRKARIAFLVSGSTAVGSTAVAVPVLFVAEVAVAVPPDLCRAIVKDGRSVADELPSCAFNPTTRATRLMASRMLALRFRRGPERRRYRR
jgi:hypothetical protein